MGEHVIINCVGYGATLGGAWPVGAYLGSYDPEANDGWGDASWTSDPAKALVFSNATEAIRLYKAIPANRPTRPDGRPNRPLTALAIELIPAAAHARATAAATIRDLGQR